MTIVAGEPQRGSCLFFIIAKRSQTLSDVRLKTCAVDSVFYIRAFRGACECTINEVKYGCLQLLVEVFMKVVNSYIDDSRGRQEIIMCLAVLLCERFCRFANGGAKVSIKSYFMRSFFCLSVFRSSQVLGKITSIRSKLPTAACWSSGRKERKL